MVIKWWVVFVLVANVSQVDSKLVPDFLITPEPVEIKSLEIGQGKQMELVVELAIFVDTEFAKIADSSQVNLLHYWEAVLYDVHLRFATLPSFKVSFRVTTLQTITTDVDQSFLGIGDYQEEDYLVGNIANKFSFWMFSQLQKLPQFDIAVLVLGTTQLDRNGILRSRFPGSICQGNIPVHKRWLTNVVLTLQQSLPLALTQSFAETLGAPRNDEQKYWNICNPTLNTPPYCCMMNYSKPWDTIPPQFFSACTDQHLVRAMSSNIQPEDFCMDRTSSVESVIIDTEHIFKHPSKVHSFTFKEQCQLLSGDPIARVGESGCHLVQCISHTKPMPAFVFTPFSGSVCGNNGKQRCVRNHCVESEVQLVNLGTGKCLVSEYGQFSVNDQAVLRDCSKIQMDYMGTPDILKKGNVEATTIDIKYSTKFGPMYKYLTVTKRRNSSLVAVFAPDDTGLESKWIIRRLAGDKQKENFLLVHRLFCVVATDDGKNIEFHEDCSGSNLNAIWKFKKLGVESNTTTPFLQDFESYLPDVGGTSILFLVVILVLFLVRFCKCKFQQSSTVQIRKKSKESRVKTQGHNRDRVRYRKTKPN